MIAPVLMALGALGYGGPLVAFSLLILLRARIPHVRTEHVVRVFRAWGAGFGVSLGVLIYAAVWHYPSVVNPGADFPASHALRWETSRDVLRSLQVLLFGVGWVSYTVCEVWTAEPCRQLDKDGVIVDPAAYEAAADRLGRHLAFNAAVLVAVVGLAVVGDFP